MPIIGARHGGATRPMLGRLRVGLSSLSPRSAPPPTKRRCDGGGRPAPKRQAVQQSTSGSRWAARFAAPLSGRAARAAMGQATPASGKDAAAHDLGKSSETEAEHRRRHVQPVANCARCVFICARGSLEKSYGSHTNEVHGGRLRTVWLTQRPAKLAGVWGLGCLFCASHAQSTADKAATTSRPKRMGGGSRGNTKWARHEICSLTQMAVRGVRQHGETLAHRRAARAYFLPTDVPEQMVDMSVADENLFRGGVPQSADWLKAWRACRSPMSFRAESAHCSTDNFIHGVRWSGGQSRKAFKDMATIMATILRRKKRAALLAASAVSIGLDDRGAYRIITFKCDVPKPPENVPRSEWIGATSGCLGVLRRGGAPSQKTLADADVDYSHAMADSIVLAFERVMTTVTDDGEELNQDDFRAVLKKVRIGVADGGSSVQKCLQFLAVGQMPNMLMIGRDHAHAIRIACQGSLVAEEHFGAWWSDVFDARHALVPDIKNSEEWKEKLLLCQRQVLGSSGVQGGGLATTIRSISFAKQRFDSCATPQRQYCCLQVAIGMLLAHVASDDRQTNVQRCRARRRLQEMSQNVLTAGLSASYSEECIRFIRKFDKHDHDPALTWGQKHDFAQRMKYLFLDGHIWQEASDGNTCLQIALKTAMEAEPIYYDDGQVVRLWCKPSHREMTRMSDSVHAVVDAMSARVDAELPVSNLAVKFTVFDLSRWYSARAEARRKGEDDADSPFSMTALAFLAKGLFSDWHLDARVGVQEFTGAVHKLLRKEDIYLFGGKPRDNRVAWSRVLHESDFGKLSVLPNLIRVYLAAMDGTCGIERDLGSLTRVLGAHVGPLDEDGRTAACLTEILLDGPTDESELATHAIPAQGEGVSGTESLLPTEFTRDCVAMWVAWHGRRFSRRRFATKPKKNKESPSVPRAGTLRSVSVQTAKGMDSLVRSASRSDGADDRTLLKLPRSWFAQRAERKGPANPQCGPGIKKFRALTQLKLQKSTTLVRARRQTKDQKQNPYTVPKLNPMLRQRRGNVLSKRPAVLKPLSKRVVSVQGSRFSVKLLRLRPALPRPSPGVSVQGSRCSVKVVSVCGHLPDIPGSRYIKQKLGTSSATMWKVLSEVDLIVLSSVWEMDSERPTEERLIVAAVAVGLGKSLLAKAGWTGISPHISPAVVRLLPASKKGVERLVLATPLRTEAPRLCHMFEKIAKLPDSKWEILEEAPPTERPGPKPKPSTTLSSLPLARAFLLRTRRVWRERAGLSGKYFQ